MEQNIDNTYSATIKVFKQESPQDNGTLTINNDQNNIKEDNVNRNGAQYSEINNSNNNFSQISVQSQIELYPEDVMVLKIFAQVI